MRAMDTPLTAPIATTGMAATKVYKPSNHIKKKKRALPTNKNKNLFFVW
jgi:hypothetical protein